MLSILPRPATPDSAQPAAPTGTEAPQMSPGNIALGALGAAAVLAASVGQRPDSSTPQMFERQALEHARTDTGFFERLAPSMAQAAPAAGFDAASLFTFAERQLPTVFPGPVPTQTVLPFVVRVYPNGNAIGVGGEAVYVAGPIVGNVVTFVGALGDFGCVATNTACGPRPASINEVSRFLSQSTLGVRRNQINLALSRSYEGWIAEQMATPITGGTHFDWLIGAGYNGPDNRDNSNGLDNTIWRRFMTGEDLLRQRMTMALSQIMVVSVLGIDFSWRQFAVANYLDILERNAFGNFRTLLDEVTRSTAMGIYLTYRGNAKADPRRGSEPDENYAREVMQLFTIGLQQLGPDGAPNVAGGRITETYDQSDVSGLARVFTGWDVDTTGFANNDRPPEIHRRPMINVASRYETGAKTFLGVTIPAGTSAADSLRIALDTLFMHPNTPPFISRQLIQRFVTSNPSRNYVGRVAAVFANDGRNIRGNLAAVVKAILLDVEARDMNLAGTSSFGKVREPVQRFLNWARAFSPGSTSGRWTLGDMSDPATRLGQSPMRSPSVFNFFRPGYVPPNTPLSAVGLVAPELQLSTETSVAGYVNYMQNAVQLRNLGDVLVDYASIMPLTNNSLALVEELNVLLAGASLSSDTRILIKNALDTIPVPNDAGRQNRLRAALVLVLAAPEYIVQT